MNKQITKRFICGLITVLLVSLFTGCQEDSEKFQISIFSNVPEETKQSVQVFVNDSLGGGGEVIEVQTFTPMYEKLIVEVVDRSGDIILLDRELMSAISDPNGLYSLDDVISADVLPNGRSYQLEDEDGELRVFAIPILENSFLMKNSKLDPSSELIAIIPKYTKHKEDAFKYLTTLISTD